MRSLVVGASGIVGGYIVEQLVRSGQRPLALSRAARHSPEVDWVLGDLTAPFALKDLGIDTIYCTAEIGLLADALPLTASPSLKRVVAFTSTSIVTKIDSPMPEERALMQRLADGEKRLAAICAQREIGWTILRPTLIYAEGRDGNVSRLARLIKRFGVLPLMGKGEGLRQPVHAQDLAIGAIAVAASPAAINRTYTLPAARSSLIEKWQAGFSMHSGSGGGSSQCRRLFGKRRSFWQNRFFQMPILLWAVA